LTFAPHWMQQQWSDREERLSSWLHESSQGSRWTWKDVLAIKIWLKHSRGSRGCDPVHLQQIWSSGGGIIDTGSYKSKSFEIVFRCFRHRN
jgi:hypothetical protein